MPDGVSAVVRDQEMLDRGLGAIREPFASTYALAPEETRGIERASFADGREVTGIAMVESGSDISILLDRTPIATVRAMEMAGVDGCTFRFILPETCFDGASHALAVRTASGRSIPFEGRNQTTADEIRFTGEPLAVIEGVVDGYQGGRIRGWAVRRHLRTGEVETRLSIQVSCGGVVILDAVADQPRLDVAKAHGCDVKVGFNIELPPHLVTGAELHLVLKAMPCGDELHGSPLVVKPSRNSALEGAELLRRNVEDLCGQAFRLQQTMRLLMPISGATVSDYDAWARRYLSFLRQRVGAEATLVVTPLVSIVMPTYKTNIAHLAAAIESVRQQTYAAWELVIVDDGSHQLHLASCLAGYAETDSRIKVISLEENVGIGRATNAALTHCQGEYVVFFDHDDLLVEVAIETMVRAALRSGAAFLYSDEDKIDAFGTLSEPNLKPNWNYRLLLDVNYVCHLVMVERATIDNIGPLDPEFDGAQDHDFLLRISEALPPERIAHVPEILYHWRKSASSTAESGGAKAYAVEAGRRAVSAHLMRRGFDHAVVEPVARATNYRTRWNFEREPSITVIVPYKDQITTTRRCIECLIEFTCWAEITVVMVDNGSVSPEAAAFRKEFEGHGFGGGGRIVFRRVDEPFNYSRLNNAAALDFPAEFFLFLNNDVFVESGDWLRGLVDEALADPTVGIVGAKLLYPDRTVQHAGVVLGVGGVGDHAFKGLAASDGGYMSRAVCSQRYSAVTAAMMLCRGDVFMEVGGFDERDLIVAFNDVDLCLKVGRCGYAIVWTPNVVAEHHESLSRGDDISPAKAPRFFYENHVMLERWHDVLPNDPYYNPRFSRERGVFASLD